MTRLLQFAGALALGLRALSATIGPPMGPPESTAPAPAPIPTVRDLGNGRLQVGHVTLDKTRRTVTFPVVVNQSAGPVEYAVVTPTGKIHESVFRTPAEPRDLHVALLLLGAQPANTSRFDPDPASTPPGTSVTLDLAWQRHGRRIQRPLADCIRVIDPPGRLPEGPWVYNGSFVIDGTFAAQQTGSIIALQEDPAALVNNPRPGRFNDELHQVNSKALPPRNTLADLIIGLRSSAAPRLRTGPAEGTPRDTSSPAIPPPHVNPVSQ